MDVLSNLERHWQRFPSLRELLKDARLPDEWHHHLGRHSPYTTILEDLRDIATIAAVVCGARQSVIQQVEAMAERASQDSVGALHDLESRLSHDLAELHDGLMCFGEMLKDLAAKAQEVRCDVGATISRRIHEKPATGRT